MKKLYNNLVNIGILYLTIPIIIFIIGFLNIPSIIISLIILIICIYKSIIKEKTNINKYNKNNCYLIVITIILIIWLFLSGIGGFSFQNTDYNVRNAVLRDLINYNWPITFDFNNTSQIIKDAVGLNSEVGFVYYFTYWLPTALLGKAFGITFANIFLFLWSLLGLLIIVGLINNYCKKQSKYTLLFLILFAGLDAIFYIGTKQFSLFEINHLEWWNNHLQYTSNTSLIYWVFNQTIPSWLIVCILLNTKKSSTTIFISSLIFGYSPFATFGMIPIAIYLSFTRFYHEYKESKLKIKQFIFKNIPLIEILWIIIELIIFGSFYLSANSSISINGFAWDIFNLDIIEFIGLYIIFIFCEIGIYFLILYKRYKNNKLFWLVIIELLLIPLYVMTPANDFCMRASIIPLFILVVLLVDYFTNYLNIKEIKKSIKTNHIYIINIALIIICFICISITPIHEINRSFYYTFINKKTLKENIYSIGNPITKKGAMLCSKQFYAKNYKDQFFYKYLSRK